MNALSRVTKSNFSGSRGCFSAIGLYVGLAVLFLLGCIWVPGFFTIDNQRDLFRGTADKGLISLGMTFVIITAGIDLSVGRLIGLSSTIAAMLLMGRTWTRAAQLAVPAMALGGLLSAGWLTWAIAGATRARRPWRLALSAIVGLAVAAALAAWGSYQVPRGFGVTGVLVAVPMVGLLFGALNGVIVAKGRLQPFIVTLAMMVSSYGLAKMIAGSGGRVHSVYFGTGPEQATATFQLLRYQIWDAVPVPALFFLGCALIGHVVLSTQRFGRHVYAVGGNEEGARLSGINVDAVKIAVYSISGLLAGLSGVLACAQYRHGKPDVGEGGELDAIAAVVIGGTSLMGGRGRMSGTFVGVLIFQYLKNILYLRGYSSEVQLVLTGVIILLAVLLQEAQFRRLRR